MFCLFVIIFVFLYFVLLICAYTHVGSSLYLPSCLSPCILFVIFVCVGKTPSKTRRYKFSIPSYKPSGSVTFVREKEVLKAIRSFPCGSAGSPDGLRPQHLKDLICDSAEKGGKDLVHALSSLYLACFGGKHTCYCSTIFLWSFTHSLEKEGRWCTSDRCGSDTTSSGLQVCWILYCPVDAYCVSTKPARVWNSCRVCSSSPCSSPF